MLEKVAHIKNPLTVIAIFAGIAEISGTIVLPFISEQNQSTYIWFLMLFPIYLVGTFFRTLNRDHTVLYAPSDYKDENNFVNPIARSTPSEQATKLAEEAAEFVTDAPNDEGSDITSSDDATGNAAGTGEPSETTNSASQGTSSISLPKPPLFVDPSDSDEQSESAQFENKDARSTFIPRVKNQSKKYVVDYRTMADVAYSEKLAIYKVIWETGLKFKRDLKFNTPEAPVLFDAAAIEQGNLHALEVKVFKSKIITKSRIISTFNSCLKVIQAPNFTYSSFTLHIVLVIPSKPDAQTKKEMESYVHALGVLYPFSIKVYISSLEELQPPRERSGESGGDQLYP